MPLFLPTTVLTQAQVEAVPLVESGKCSINSGVTVGDSDMSQFNCNAVIIAHTARGVLIQFADKSGDDGRLLGFAGSIEGKQGFGADSVQTVKVERLYLMAGGKPMQVDVGTCFMNWTGLQRTGGQLTSVTCGGRASAEGSEVRAVVQFEVMH